MNNDINNVFVFGAGGNGGSSEPPAMSEDGYDPDAWALVPYMPLHHNAANDDDDDDEEVEYEYGFDDREDYKNEFYGHDFYGDERDDDDDDVDDFHWRQHYGDPRGEGDYDGGKYYEREHHGDEFDRDDYDQFIHERSPAPGFVHVLVVLIDRTPKKKPKKSLFLRFWTWLQQPLVLLLLFPVATIMVHVICYFLDVLNEYLSALYAPEAVHAYQHVTSIHWATATAIPAVATALTSVPTSTGILA